MLSHRARDRRVLHRDAQPVRTRCECDRNEIVRAIDPQRGSFEQRVTVEQRYRRTGFSLDANEDAITRHHLTVARISERTVGPSRNSRRRSAARSSADRSDGTRATSAGLSSTTGRSRTTVGVCDAVPNCQSRTRLPLRSRPPSAQVCLAQRQARAPIPSARDMCRIPASRPAGGAIGISTSPPAGTDDGSGRLSTRNTGPTVRR